MEEHDQNKESLWRRKLSGAEREALRSQPELELEARLTEALGRVPDAPVPSNFTARVLASIDLEEERSRRSGWSWSWHSFLPRLAGVTAILLFAGATVYHHELKSKRTAMAQNVALLTQAQTVPSVEALKNFDVIQVMGQPHRADDELLALMQ